MTEPGTTCSPISLNEPTRNHYTAPNMFFCYTFFFKYYYLIILYRNIPHENVCVNASCPLEFSILSQGTQPETNFFLHPHFQTRSGATACCYWLCGSSGPASTRQSSCPAVNLCTTVPRE